MTVHLQLFATNGEKWESVKDYSSPEDLGTARKFADQLVESGQFRNAMVVEKMADDPKVKFKPVYRKSLNAKKNKRKTERLELFVKTGLTGEWIVIPEKYAKRYKYYGVNGFLTWIGLALVVSPFLQLIGYTYFDDVLSAPLDAILFIAGIFAVESSIVWGLAYALWKKKSGFPICAIVYASVTGVISFLAVDVVGLGKSLLVLTYILISRRVNATYRHRIRRHDLEYTIPLKKLEYAKFVSAKDVRKKKRK